MRSSGRLLSSLQAQPTNLSKSRFVCSNCRQQFRPRSLGVTTTCRNASGSTPFTEKVRRKIWGTDNPPGLKDPYGGESFVEKALRKRRGEEEVEQEQEPEPEREPIETTPPEEYAPASTWEGLEEVGSLGRWWEDQPTEADNYQRFMSETKLTTRDEMMAALHQVMLEISLVKELEKPLGMISKIEPYTLDQYSIISQTKINPSSDKSSAVLSFDNAQAKESLLVAFEQAGKEPQETILPAEGEEEADIENVLNEAEENAESTAILPPKDLGFLSISLEDPATKFAVFKRTAQITGHRIPDHLISSIKTVSDLMKHLMIESKPKPRKLAESLAADERLNSLPNVKIMGRRMTPIDKEKEIGRWKVIEEELTRRGLPVTGKVPLGVPKKQEA